MIGLTHRLKYLRILPLVELNRRVDFLYEIEHVHAVGIVSPNCDNQSTLSDQLRTNH